MWLNNPVFTDMYVRWWWFRPNACVLLLLRITFSYSSFKFHHWLPRFAANLIKHDCDLRFGEFLVIDICDCQNTHTNHSSRGRGRCEWWTCFIDNRKTSSSYWSASFAKHERHAAVVMNFQIRQRTFLGSPMEIAIHVHQEEIAHNSIALSTYRTISRFQTCSNDTALALNWSLIMASWECNIEKTLA